MSKSTEQKSQSSVEKVSQPDETSSFELDSEALDSLNSESLLGPAGFRPSKTLLAALFILAITFGIAGYAGFMLWSLSDHPANSEECTDC